MSDLQDKIAKVAARNERIHKGLELLEKQSMQLGAKYERERIIELLEGYFKPDEAKSIYPADYEQYLDLIALIKGEQK